MVWLFSKASEHDSKFVIGLLKKARDKELLTKRIGADKAYDSDDFRLEMILFDVIPVIEYKENV